MDGPKQVLSLFEEQEGVHVYTEAALARLRSGSARSPGGRNCYYRTAHIDDLTFEYQLSGR